MINDQKLLFERFISQKKLSDAQASQFHAYLILLQEWNKRFNLTRIDSFEGILQYHFQDSLCVGDIIDINTIKAIADIGAGAGFPGIPLKIKYPHLSVILIEVSGKKVSFLNEVIQTLKLENVSVVQLDWRTFLRRTKYEIDLFCARASLSVPELLRLFRSSCPYKNASLAYWAPRDWQPLPTEQSLIVTDKKYFIDNDQRRLVIFKS